MALPLMKTTGHRLAQSLDGSSFSDEKIGCRPDFFCDTAATKQPTTKPMPKSNKNDHKLD
jgi:hypothetical protein